MSSLGPGKVFFLFLSLSGTELPEKLTTRPLHPALEILERMNGVWGLPGGQ